MALLYICRYMILCRHPLLSASGQLATVSPELVAIILGIDPKRKVSGL